MIQCQWRKVLLSDMTQEHVLLSTWSFLFCPIILCPHNIIKPITGPLKQFYKDTINLFGIFRSYYSIYFNSIVGICQLVMLLETDRSEQVVVWIIQALKNDTY